MRGVALTLLAFALVALLLAWSRRIARRRVAALGHLALATACAALAALAWYGTAALEGFQPIYPDRPLAEIRFDADGSGRYTATLMRLPDGRLQLFDLPGNQWRMTVRTLGATPAGARLGLRPAVRLAVLESALDGEVQRSYALSAADRPDAWASTRAGRPWSWVATAAEADTGWRPMVDRGRYRVQLAAGRLVPDPVPDGTALTP